MPSLTEPLTDGQVLLTPAQVPAPTDRDEPAPEFPLFNRRSLFRV